jgi:Sec-independent protein translocase protein TatA
MKEFFYLLLLYMLFQFIFRFVVPVFVAARKMRKGFKAMKEQMNNAQQGNYQGFNNTTESQSTAYSTQKKDTPPAQKEDYLDFEEVKD